VGKVEWMDALVAEAQRDGRRNAIHNPLVSITAVTRQLLFPTETQDDKLQP
jgi:hypothetical protein